MITTAQKLMRDRRSLNYARLRMDLCGPYVCDDIESDQVSCRLQIAGTMVAVDLPADILARHQQSGARDKVVLRIPGNGSAAVETVPVLSRKQRRQAAHWISEMENFDRF